MVAAVMGMTMVMVVVGGDHEGSGDDSSDSKLRVTEAKSI